MATPDKN